MMAGAPALLLLLAGGADMPHLLFHKQISVNRPLVTVKDVMDISALPPALRANAARTEVIRLEPEQKYIRLSGAYLRSRIQSQMPALAPLLRDMAKVSVTIVYRDRAAISSAESSCIASSENIGKGRPARADMFGIVGCTGTRSRTAFHFDRDRAIVVAARDIRAGEAVEAWGDYGDGSVSQGAELTLVSRAGPAIIERPVRALQSARNGSRLFVRTTDGDVLSVRYSGGHQ